MDRGESSSGDQKTAPFDMSSKVALDFPKVVSDYLKIDTYQTCFIFTELLDEVGSFHVSILKISVQVIRLEA